MTTGQTRILLHEPFCRQKQVHKFLILTVNFTIEKPAIFQNS